MSKCVETVLPLGETSRGIPRGETVTEFVVLPFSASHGLICQ
jgi:hypothetical protein